MIEHDWFEQFEWQARLHGDQQRILLGQLHRQAYQFRESDPDRALQLIDQGRALAARLEEPWWVLFYRQQRVHALLHFKQDFREVLELAIANVLELSRHGFAGFPRALMIHGDLVSAYLGIDPVGHVARIVEALNYLDRQIEPLCSERYLLLGSQRQLAVECGDLEKARQLAQQSLNLASDDPDTNRGNHFAVFAYSSLCEIAHILGDWDRLAEAIAAGEELAVLVGHQNELAGFRLWRALLARRAGEETQARALHRQGTALLARLRMPADPAFRDAECAFHEAAGHFDRALRVRDAELASLQQRGRLRYEAQVCIKRCSLLSRLNQLSQDDLTATRQAIRKLVDPTELLAELDRIARGAS